MAHDVLHLLQKKYSDLVVDLQICVEDGCSIVVVGLVVVLLQL